MPNKPTFAPTPPTFARVAFQRRQGTNGAKPAWGPTWADVARHGARQARIFSGPTRKKGRVDSRGNSRRVRESLFRVSGI
jgi:hypothetical protein